MPKRVNAWYGWSPDKPDFRDLRLTPPVPVKALPLSADLRSGFPDCYDQGQLGSCTANAIAGALEFDQRKQSLKEFTPSRLFIYYNERVMEGTVSEDSGAQIRDGIKSVSKLGAPPEIDWKYVISKFTHKPTKKAFTDGKKHTAVKYQRVVQTLDQMRSCLAGGLPFVFGFTVYESFESDQVAKDGIVPMPGSDEQTVGGHAVVAVGYDDSKQWFIVRNSWATDWGVNGYFFLPYAYLSDNNLADDLWQISLTK